MNKVGGGHAPLASPRLPAAQPSEGRLDATAGRPAHSKEMARAIFAPLNDSFCAFANPKPSLDAVVRHHHRQRQPVGKLARQQIPTEAPLFS
jgi:hypothetical protein